MFFPYVITIPLVFGGLFSAYYFFTSSYLADSISAFGIVAVYFFLTGHAFNAAYRKAKQKARQKSSNGKTPNRASIPLAVKIKHWICVSLVIMIAGTLACGWFAVKNESAFRKAQSYQKKREQAHKFLNGYQEIISMRGSHSSFSVRSI